MNENIKKWTAVGLLEGVDESRKALCADSLEDMANYITGLLDNQNQLLELKSTNQSLEFIVGTILPIITRLYIHHDERNKIAAKELFDKFIKFIKCININDIKFNDEIDLYENFCENYSELKD